MEVHFDWEKIYGWLITTSLIESHKTGRRHLEGTPVVRLPLPISEIREMSEPVAQEASEYSDV